MYNYWSKIYLQHAKSKSYLKQLDLANKVIDEALDLGIRSCGNISGGKDSTCLMNLLFTKDSSFKFVTEKDEMDFPDELDYINNFISKGYNIDIIKPKISLWDSVKDFNICEDIHSKGTNFSDTYFYNLLKDYQKTNKYKLIFLGLRAEESKGRAFNYKTKGHIYYNKTWQQIVVQPLATWTAKDVFAYLFSNNLPILNMYFKTKFVSSPEQIRKSWVLPSAQANAGQVQYLKYYYPDIYNKLSKFNPNIRSYT